MNQDINILIVDDFSTMRKIVKDLLEELGFKNFDEAYDGENAWQKLSNHHFDLIVSDWNMPNLSGLELLKLVRNDPSLKNIPFLLISAEAKRSQIIEATDAGVDGYIVKPFNSETLNEKIHSIFNQRSEL
ncbi:response regulator [Thiomicrorhabdus sp.]|uniref:response regulator n=1 Tax=Thiomicrorhabdus sp. TaxID=2039724 RepID=UPI002AA886E0|nr:response regulator [Thiomicrorhabdus sp.]